MNIAIDDLAVSYGGTEVLHNIKGKIASGRWLAPIGPNGAGKSTLLRAIAGLIPYRGVITIDGVAVSAMQRRSMAQLIAFVPQRPQLPPTMTVADYVLLGRTPHISYFGFEKRHDHHVVCDVLERLSLEQLARRPLGAISGGESQRAVLGRALAQQAPIMLLDEPTSSLDLGRQQQVLELVDELRKERNLTIVSAMHDLTLAGQFAEELWLIDDGSIIARGTAGEVLTVDRVMSHYGATVARTISPDQSGGVLVVPLRTRVKHDYGRAGAPVSDLERSSD